MDIHHENCPLTDALMNTVDALVVVADPQGRILQFNKACEEATGFSADEMVGRLIVDALIPADQRSGVSTVIDDLATPGTNRFESDWMTADGRRRRIAWSNATMIDSDRNVTAIIGTGVDITDQRLLESRLAQADRFDSVGRLAAGIAHDFNNSLTSLVLRVERLAGRDIDHDSRTDIDAITAMIDRTQNLINELLSFSSPRRTEPTRLDVNSEVLRVLDILTGLLGSDIEVELDLAEDTAVVLIEQAGFEQVLTNLFINARDAMPSGGRVTIATTVETIEPHAGPSAHIPGGLAPGVFVRLSVADTGTGIQHGDLSRVFDPYFTTKGAGRGTGLGLATTYATLGRHRGAITVDSEPGRGAEFEVWLPLDPIDDDHVPRRTVGASVHHEPHLALLVDDDVDLRRALADEFQRLGCATITAANGEQALAHLDEPIDLLLTDLDLPDIGGHEIADRFRRHRPDLSIVYATGAADRQLGGLPDDAVVLRKPFTMTDLVARIRTHLGASVGEDARPAR